ncbi:MAG: hypothetical protein RR756_06175 [Cetobacterium sp.]
MLKSTHDKIVSEFDMKLRFVEEELEKREIELLQVKEQLKASRKIKVITESKNCELNVKLAVEIDKSANKDLEIEELKKEIDILNSMYQAEKTNVQIVAGRYNNINKKLWCNEESKRQLKCLIDEIRDADRVDKNRVAKYLEEINWRLGGSENIKTIKELKKIERRK